MRKPNQRLNVTDKLRAGPNPVVTTAEIAGAAGQSEINGRTYALIKRLKSAQVIEPLKIRGAYDIIGRQASDLDRAAAWCRLHPGQGQLIRGRCLKHRGQMVVEVLQHAKAKGLESYWPVCYVAQLKPTEPWQVLGRED